MRPLAPTPVLGHADGARHLEPTVLAVVGLAAALLLGGGDDSLGLTEPESVLMPSEAAQGEGTGTPSAPDPGGAVPLPVGLGVTAAAMAALLLKRDELVPGDALMLDESPVVVFVPGHGQGAASEVFEDLVAEMGLDDESARFFDYRLASDLPDPRLASRSVPVDAAAAALNAYVAGVADEGRPVYMVGFSKGGATVAEVVADWDDGGWGPADAVIGAALLDPPIASGAHGRLQSLGHRIGPVPDDGGYEPVQCAFLRFGCTDRRVGLGEVSGVEVVVVRNPKAGITSFADRPDGLRVYDAPDAGPTILEQMVQNPLRVAGRIAEAHESVLHDRSVAACIVAEMRSGRCGLPQRSHPAHPPVLRRAIRAPSGQRML